MMPRIRDTRPEVRLPIAQIVSEVGEKYKLTEVQKSFLSVRMMFASDKDACHNLSISTHTLHTWREHSLEAHPQRPKTYRLPDFKSAEKEFYTRQAQAAEEAVNQLLMKAVNEADKLMDGKKLILNSRGEVIAEVPDHWARAKGIELVMRWAGKWSDTVKHEVDPKYTQAIEEFSRMILAAQERPMLPAPDVIEGEIIEN